MAYLEELLPEFRKGAKIRIKDWDKGEYICIEDNEVVNENRVYQSVFYTGYLTSDEWELYQEPEPDWDYIIKNKRLCWFWDEGEEGNKIAGILRRIQKDSPIPFITDTGEYDYTTGYANCRPVYRNEVTFYEDKKDE